MHKVVVPDAYQQGMVEFFLLPFFVDERALIPRLETESLVRYALSRARTTSFDAIMDIGTGSGIIAVSIAHSVPSIPIYGIDINPDSLDLAEKNARHNGVSVLWHQSDLFASIPMNELQGKHVLIVTNLPYIKQGSLELSEDTIFEPQIALFWGQETGFEMYARFFESLFAHSEQYDFSGEVCLEMGHDQNMIAAQELTKYPWKYQFFADLRGIQRFIHIVF